MTDRDKLIEYELLIEDMLRTLSERKAELENSKELNDFEQGRYLAYIEIMDIIRTRYNMIWDVIS